MREEAKSSTEDRTSKRKLALQNVDQKLDEKTFGVENSSDPSLNPTVAADPRQLTDRLNYMR